MNILISAYAFSPYRGSECAVGWNVVRELLAFHDVTVITGDVMPGQNDWNRYVKEHGGLKGLSVNYIEPGALIRILERLHRLPGLWPLYYFAYNLWQRKAYAFAKQLLRAKRFDLVHHLTMIGFREPGYMWKLGLPFVWGPVGGGVDEPVSFWSLYSRGARIKVVLRNLANAVQKRLTLRPRCAARSAVWIWTVSNAEASMIRSWGATCTQMIESAASPYEGARIRNWRQGDPFRIVWSGTHTYGKALPILIAALARIMKSINDVNVIVDVLGQGVETFGWKSFAEKLSVSDCFRWRGFLTRDRAMAIMNEAHALAFTSVKEGTPHVVLEALSMGLPVICHDACGMGVVVDSTCGIKIQMKSPEASIAGFTHALEDLLTHPARVEELSLGALKRARAFTWSQKARQISEAYERSVKG